MSRMENDQILCTALVQSVTQRMLEVSPDGAGVYAPIHPSLRARENTGDASQASQEPSQQIPQHASPEFETSIDPGATTQIRLDLGE